MYKLKIIYIIFLILFSVVALTVIPIVFMIGHYSREIQSSLIERIFVIAFYSLILSFILSLFLSRKITRPLSMLKKAAFRVREGKFDFEIPYRASDEFGELIKTFNIMTRGLKETTEELKKKEFYIERMTDPLIVIDQDGKIIDINPAFTRLFGYERDEILGVSVQKTFPEFKNNEERTGELKGITKEGNTIPLLFTATSMKFNGTEYTILTLKDFREGLALREEIRLSRDYLETIMNSIQDELLVIDRDFSVIKANDAVRKRIGMNPEGKFCYSISHLLERPCSENRELRCPVRMVFNTGMPFVTEHEHKDLTGKNRTYEIIAYPLKGKDERVDNVIEFMRDITEKKSIEEELRKKNRELGLLNEVSAILSRSLKAEEIFNSVIEKLKETFGMDGGGIFILDRETLVCRYHSGISEEFIRQAGRVPLGIDIPGRVAQSGTIVCTNDVSMDPRLERSILRHAGIKGYCCIPLKGKERILGVFCLFTFRPYKWSMEDEDILRSIGELIGLAFENIFLYEKSQNLYRTLRDKRQKELEDLSIMVDILSGTRGLEELMENSLIFIKERLNTDGIGLIRKDQSGNFILRKLIPRIKGIDEPLLLYNENVSSQEALSIKEGVIVQVKDIKLEPRFYYHDIFRNNFISYLTIPLSSGERTIGALSLFSKTPRDFQEEEIHFLKIFSTVLGLSIERSESYEILLRQEALSTTILDSIEDGVYTVDTEGYITSMNRASEEIFGLRRERTIGKKCRDLMLHGTEKPLCGTEECPLNLALQGSASSTEMEYINPKGRRFILQISCLPLREPVTGNITGAVQVFRDVTGQKELDRIKTEIIRSVSHEFRTPLTAIIGMSEMILNGDVSGERAREYLNIMYKEGLRLSKMISELLDISRLEKKEFFKIGPVDFKKIIESIKEAFSDIIEKKSALIAIRVEGDLSGFRGDEAKIEQMLRNLIDNSLTYSDSGVRVSVLLRRVKDMLEINVRDTGWGIAEEDIPHLGEKFYRGKHGERTKGTGLGLSLVKEIVKLHGGILSIESQPEKGTSIHISLPFQVEVKG
ncbi:MAG: PAS domain S-box protein [Thermodesulfovibrionales bacterium]|nr:PAS domain S-box protein [Thermodesulfovibrionales bacterium]